MYSKEVNSFNVKGLTRQFCLTLVGAYCFLLEQTPFQNGAGMQKNKLELIKCVSFAEMANIFKVFPVLLIHVFGKCV